MPTTHSHQMFLRNTCGKRRYFAYLGLHGAELDDGADIAVTGNIWDIHWRNQMLVDAFVADLEAHHITILKSTDVFVYDTTDTRVWVLAADNSLNTLDNPDYGSYVGSAPDV